MCTEHVDIVWNAKPAPICPHRWRRQSEEWIMSQGDPCPSQTQDSAANSGTGKEGWVKCALRCQSASWASEYILGCCRTEGDRDVPYRLITLETTL